MLPAPVYQGPERRRRSNRTNAPRCDVQVHPVEQWRDQLPPLIGRRLFPQRRQIGEQLCGLPDRRQGLALG